MMDMILQQIFKSSQLDGMLPKSQSADSEITQSPVFGEILKDEEKKLQQAQEINALSVAGILLAMQAPLIAESTPVINASYGSKTGNSEKQPAPKVESAKQMIPALIAEAAQPINKISEMPVAVLSDAVNQKFVVDGKPVEVQPRVVVSAPTVPEKEMVQPAALAQNEKPEMPATVRADVASEKPILETKSVESQPRVVVSAPAVPEKEMVQPAALAQNEKPEMPATVRVEVISEKPIAEAKTVESQPRVVVSTPTVPEKEMVQPAALGQNEKPEMPTTVRADVISAKPVLETKTVEAQPRVVVSAPTVSEKEMVQPATLGQNEKLEMPATIRAEVISAKPILETKAVEAQPRIVVSAPAVTEKEMVQPAALGQNEKPEMPATVRAEARTVESQPRVVVSAPTVPEKVMVQPATLGQNEKPEMPATVRAEAKTVESQPRAVVSAPAVPEKEMVQPAALGQNEKPEMPATVRAEAKTVEVQPHVVVSAPTVPEKAMALPEANVQSENIEITTALRAESEKPEAQVNAWVQQPVSRVGKEAEAPEVAVVVAESHNQNEKISADEMQDVDLAAVPTGFVNEAVVIKTAEKLPATQVNAQAAEVIEQVMSQMKVKIKSGSTSMSLQLNPKELGAIEVQMVRNAQGVSVTFFIEQASTGQLLESQMSNLRQSLKDAGVQLIGLNISQHDQPKQEGGFFRQDPQFNQTSQRNAFQTETASMERELPERIGGLLSNEVDYLI